MSDRLALAKRHMNIAGSDDDVLIDLYLDAAKEYLDGYIGESMGAWQFVPADLKLAVLKLAAFYYENREAAAAFGASMQIAPYGVTTVADSYRRAWFGRGAYG